MQHHNTISIALQVTPELVTSVCKKHLHATLGPENEVAMKAKLQASHHKVCLYRAMICATID